MVIVNEKGRLMPVFYCSLCGKNEEIRPKAYICLRARCLLGDVKRAIPVCAQVSRTSILQERHLQHRTIVGRRRAVQMLQRAITNFGDSSALAIARRN